MRFSNKVSLEKKRIFTRTIQRIYPKQSYNKARKERIT